MEVPFSHNFIRDDLCVLVNQGDGAGRSKQHDRTFQGFYNRNGFQAGSWGFH